MLCCDEKTREEGITVSRSTNVTEVSSRCGRRRWRRHGTLLQEPVDFSVGVLSVRLRLQGADSLCEGVNRRKDGEMRWLDIFLNGEGGGAW